MTSVDDELIVSGGVRLTGLSGAQSLGTDSSGNVQSSTPIRRFSLVEASGDSYGQGVGSMDKQHGYTSILASLLGVPLINRSIGGAVAAWPIQDLNAAGDGGWANVLQSITTLNTAAPYMPLHSLVSLSYSGFNDMWDNGHSAAVGPFISALRLIISRHRAAAIFPYTYFTSVTNATLSATGKAGDGLLTLKSTSSPMAGTYTVPSDMPTGCVPVIYGESTAGSVGTISFTVNGTHSSANDINLATVSNVVATANVPNGWCARFPSCVAGDVVVATATYTSGPVYFNGAMIEASNPPIVITHGCPHPPVVATSYGWASTSAMNTDIDTLNTAHQALVAEFDSHVVYYDLVGVLPQIANGTAGSLYASDNLHPTPRGHSLIAQAALAAANSVALTSDQISDMSMYPPKGTKGPQQRQRTVPLSYPYQILLTDEYVAVLGSGTRSLTLPDATLSGPGSSQTIGTTGYVQSITVKDEASTSAAGNITISCLNSQTVDGASSVVIATNGGALTFISTGLEWVTVGSNSSVIENVHTVSTSGTAQTLPAPTIATMHYVTMTGNCTFTFPTAAAGASFLLVLLQDSTGSRTATWPGTVKWASGTAPTLTTTPSKADVISFFCVDGTNWIGIVGGLSF